MDLGKSKDLHHSPSVQDRKRRIMNPQLNYRQKPIDRRGLSKNKTKHMGFDWKNNLHQTSDIFYCLNSKKSDLSALGHFTTS